MLRGRVRPDAVVFNAIISGHSRQGHVHKAFKLFNTVRACSSFGQVVVCFSETNASLVKSARLARSPLKPQCK